MENGQGSALQQYTQQYGERLRSMLAPAAPVSPNAVIDTSPVLGRPGGPQPPPPATPRGAAPMGSALEAQAPPPAPEMMEEEPPAKKGTSVRDLFGGMPKEEQVKQADELEEILSRGGKTIDSAYDELIKQMGTRPDEKLSREEKSMLMIEFGLNLMANSSGNAYGQDLAGAAGAAGLSTLGSYRATKGARARKYDENRSALEVGRAKDKLDLSKTAATEQIKRDLAPGQKPEIFPGGDGFLYQNINGKTSKLLDEAGNPVKATKKDLEGSDGAAAPKPTEFERRYQMYIDVHGKDPNGQPLSGEPAEKVKKKALEFAADQKNSTLSDAEIRSVATKAVDDHLRYFADLFRDYSPSQLEEYRTKLVEERVKEMKAGLDADQGIEPPPPPPRRTSMFEMPGTGNISPLLPKKTTPPVEALVAGKARRIKGYEGRWTLVNGKPTRVD